MQRNILRVTRVLPRCRVITATRSLIQPLGQLSYPLFYSQYTHYSTNTTTTVEENTQSVSTLLDSTSTEPTTNNEEYYTLSFYRFIEIPAIELYTLRKRLTEQLESMNVLGRIYVATEGINAQISCPRSKLDQLRELCDTYDILRGIDFNMSTEHHRAFRRLAIRIKKQIVADGRSSETYDLTKQPTYLDAETWHHELSSKPALLIDMRNHYESEIGYFEGAQRPDVDTFRDGLDEMERLVANVPKDQPIYMYCTGGIRCSKAGAILRSQGWDDIRMLKGGITAYGRYVREIPDIKSLFRGKNFTFDKRLGESIAERESEDTVSRCHQCGAPCDRYTNCRNRRCNLLFIQCDACRTTYSRTCGSTVCIEVERAERETAAEVTEELAATAKRTDKQACVHPYHERIRPRKIMRQWPIVLGGYPERIRPRLVLEQVFNAKKENTSSSQSL